MAEGPPLNLSVNGDLVFISGGSSRQFTTSFDLRLFYPNLVVAGSYTANCAHVASAHIPLPAPGDPTSGMALSAPRPRWSAASL